MYDVTHNIEDSKKGKAKYSNEFTMQCYLLFLLLCIEMFRGEEEKRRRTDNSKSWNNKKPLRL